MRSVTLALLLLPASFAGCLGSLSGSVAAEGESLLILVEQTYQVTGSGTARANFESPCAFAFTRDPAFVAYAREDRGPAAPGAVLVRSYARGQGPSEAEGGSVPRVVPSEAARELYELDTSASIGLLSPFLSGPAVSDLTLDGGILMVDSYGILRPGDAHATRTSYQLAQEGGTFHVVESLVIRNLGWVRPHLSVADGGGACA